MHALAFSERENPSILSGSKIDCRRMQDLKIACADMFRRHRVEAFGGAFHVPAAREYGCLFAWDSGYHALALRHLDIAAAREELRTLYAANTTDTGLLAHERPLPGSDERTALVTSWFGPIYRSDGRSFLVDPPVAAYAAAKLTSENGDTSLLDAAQGHLDAIEGARIADEGYLPAILHPLESGTDASPLFDGLIDASSRRAFVGSLRSLSEALQKVDWSAARALRERHRFVVADPTFCGWHLLALEALADARRRVGDARRAGELDARALVFAQNMMNALWSDRLGLFVGFDYIRGLPIEIATLGGIVAAASRSVRKLGLTARVIDEHLHPAQSSFWGAKGIAFNPRNGRAIEPRSLLWRGDCVWGATQYWAHLVLSRSGQVDAAQTARLQMEALIESEGFREFYDANSGKGHGAGLTDGFTWPALALEMTAEEDGADR